MFHSFIVSEGGRCKCPGGCATVWRLRLDVCLRNPCGSVGEGAAVLHVDEAGTAERANTCICVIITVVVPGTRGLVGRGRDFRGRPSIGLLLDLRRPLKCRHRTGPPARLQADGRDGRTVKCVLVGICRSSSRCLCCRSPACLHLRKRFLGSRSFPDPFRPRVRSQLGSTTQPLIWGAISHHSGTHPLSRPFLARLASLTPASLVVSSVPNFAAPRFACPPTLRTTLLWISSRYEPLSTFFCLLDRRTIPRNQALAFVAKLSAGPHPIYL